MFDEKLIIMDRRTQSGPAGTIVIYTEGQNITMKAQLSNMLNIQIANAQGVKAVGYIAPDAETAKNYKIGLGTVFKYPAGGNYLRVLDNGIEESGAKIMGDKQFAVEALPAPPKT